MTPEEALSLIAQGESGRLEFKQSWRLWREAIESVTAFANTEGGGYVFIGVHPNGSRNGSPDEEGMLGRKKAEG